EPEAHRQGERRCDPGHRAGPPGSPRALFALRRRLVGELPAPGRSDVRGRRRRHPPRQAPGPGTGVRVEQGRVPLCDAGLDARRPARRHAVSGRGDFSQPAWGRLAESKAAGRSVADKRGPSGPSVPTSV
ncbi:hypothetical protein AVDCRST_MAG82-2309, partial [uncultured Rubrobacteraceae bacterium]